MPSESRKTSGLALGKYKCPDCAYKTTSSCNMTRHVRLHSGERPFACPSCDSKFSLKENRKKHIRQVHLKADQVTCTWSACDKTFTSARNLQEHVAAVHLKTRFACPVPGCKYTSGWKTNINPHIKAVHTHSKSYICSFAGCSYRTGYHSNLSKHRQCVHGGERFACSYDGCDFQTSQSENLKKHTQSVHEKKVRFACHVCSKSFYQKDDMSKHKQVHAKKGHQVAECASCQVDLRGCKLSSLVNQEEQPSSSNNNLSNLLTTFHLDLNLLSVTTE